MSKNTAPKVAFETQVAEHMKHTNMGLSQLLNQLFSKFGPIQVSVVVSLD